MKKITTFLSVLALMFASVDANAQLVDGTDYIIQNVETGKYLGGANSWGTQASLVEHPQIFTATFTNGILKLDSHTYNSATAHFLGDNLYVDNDGAAITLTATTGGAYKMKVGNVMCGIDGNVLADKDNATWKITSVAEALKDVNQKDLTFLIKGASFSRNHYSANFEPAWTVSASNKNLSGGANENMCAESWCSAFTISQDISIPNGIYVINAQAALTDYTNKYDGANYPVVFANEVSSPFNDMDAKDRGTSMSQLSGSFTNGMYYVNPLTVKVTNGQLTVGVKGTRTDTWCIWDNFQIERYIATLGEPVFSPADQAKVSADDVTSITISFPDQNLINGFTASYEWSLKEDGTVLKNGKGTFDATYTITFPVDLAVGHTYTVDLTTNVNDDNGVSVNGGTYQSSLRTLTLTELAVAEFDETVNEANNLYKYALENQGVGLMLYHPADVDKYYNNLQDVYSVTSSFAIYNDYKEGTDILRALMMDFKPQLPKVNQRYTIQHKASGLYLNITDQTVSLQDAATPVAFHHIDGDHMTDAKYYMYSTPDRKYVYYTGNNTWSLTSQTSKLTLGQWEILHDYDGANTCYYFRGANGFLGTDATTTAAAIYGNKGQGAANSQWLVAPYEEPDLSVCPVPVASPMATDGTIQYLYNVEAGAFLLGANEWSTRASMGATGNQIKVENNGNGTFKINDLARTGGKNGQWTALDCQGAAEIWIDGDNRGGWDTWVLTANENGTYEITNNNVLGKLGVISDLSDDRLYMTSDDSYATSWVFVNEADYTSYQIAYSAYLEYQKKLALNKYSEGDDITDMASNAWDGASGSVAMGAEKYVQESMAAGDVMTQTVTGLKEGVYEVTIAVGASFTSGRGFECPTGEGLSEVFANDASMGISIVDRTWFNEGEQEFVTLDAVVKDGTLKMGVRNVKNAGNWYVIRLESIVYKSATIPADSAFDPVVTAINSTSTSEAPVAIYSSNGSKLNALQKGVNIVRMSDNSVRKVIVK